MGREEEDKDLVGCEDPGDFPSSQPYYLCIFKCLFPIQSLYLYGPIPLFIQFLSHFPLNFLCTHLLCTVM